MTDSRLYSRRAVFATLLIVLLTALATATAVDRIATSDRLTKGPMVYSETLSSSPVVRDPPTVADPTASKTTEEVDGALEMRVNGSTFTKFTPAVSPLTQYVGEIVLQVPPENDALLTWTVSAIEAGGGVEPVEVRLDTRTLGVTLWTGLRQMPGYVQLPEAVRESPLTLDVVVKSTGYSVYAADRQVIAAPLSAALVPRQMELVLDSRDRPAGRGRLKITAVRLFRLTTGENAMAQPAVPAAPPVPENTAITPHATLRFVVANLGSCSGGTPDCQSSVLTAAVGDRLRLQVTVTNRDTPEAVEESLFVIMPPADSSRLTVRAYASGFVNPVVLTIDLGQSRGTLMYLRGTTTTAVTYGGWRPLPDLQGTCPLLLQSNPKATFMVRSGEAEARSVTLDAEVAPP